MTSKAMKAKMRRLALVRVDEAVETIERIAGSDAPQIGLEASPQEYIARLVEIFREVRRVLRDDGTLWVVIGDCYAGSRMGGCKPKDLIGIPWMLAFALRDDGWYLRQDIRWSKPNPMPESVTDRCTKSHEYVFLLSKSKRYYFDHKAIMEPAVYPTGSRKDRRNSNSKRMKTPGAMMQGVHCSEKLGTIRDFRNKRDVWAVPTAAYKGAHFATFPPALIEPCILAGTPEGGVVLDPFTGSGTVAEVALKSFRHFVGIDLNPDYIKIAENRVASLLAQQRLDL